MCLCLCICMCVSVSVSVIEEGVLVANPHVHIQRPEKDRTLWVFFCCSLLYYLER